MTETHTKSYIKKVLAPAEWRAQKTAHEQELTGLLDDYLARRERHHKDPVMDFLFEYYAFRPSHLKRWSPGFGTLLLDASRGIDTKFDELVITDEVGFLDPALFPENRKQAVRWILNVLERSSESKPSFGCFGMHEWAMVYKKDSIRHNQVPLRMGKDELAAFVESRPLVCTHFDAFRFFSGPARPMNKFNPSRETFAGMEQPGCIHTNMDLYKWAFKLYPWTSSNTIRKAFKLAVEARIIDMKASPYDLRERGLEPVKIETEEGRMEYLECQRAIYQKSVPIREQLIEEYRYLAEFLSC